MIIEFKTIVKISSFSSLSMDSWYYDDMLKAGILIKYDDLSQSMKDYIFDKGNIRECIISHGSLLHGKIMKYIITPNVISRFEINDNIIDLEDGEILYSYDDVEYIKEILSNNDIHKLDALTVLDEYTFIEITK